MAVGAIAGGLFFGTLSSRIGRRKGIVIAALLALVMIYPWAYTNTVPTLALGAFLMQFMVQGAWGIVPVHLNELSPNAVRAMLPGLVYQTRQFHLSANANVALALGRSQQQELRPNDGYFYRLCRGVAGTCHSHGTRGERQTFRVAAAPRGASHVARTKALLDRTFTFSQNKLWRNARIAP